LQKVEHPKFEGRVIDWLSMV